MITFLIVKQSNDKETNDVIETTGDVDGLLSKQQLIANDTIKSFTNIINSVEWVVPLMEEISASSQELLASCEEVSELAIKTDDASKTLINKVDTFKI